MKVTGLKRACRKCFILVSVAMLLAVAGQAVAQSDEMLHQGTPDPVSPVNELQAPLAEKSLPRLSQISPAGLDKIASMVAEEIEQAANAQTRLKGQGRVHHVKVSFDLPNDALIVDLGKSYVPSGKYITIEFEEHLRALDRVVYNLLSEIIGNFAGVSQNLFDGKPLHYYLPDTVAPPKKEAKSSSVTPSAAPASARVMLNAGHGWYLHPTLGWTSQRDVEAGSGILEDTNTPLHVSELSKWMTARSATILSRARSTSTAAHAPSGKPWWWVGSRAYIQNLLPNNPEIWNSLPTFSYLDNDLRTRPLYANYLKTNAMISLHTNAAPENRTIRGTQVVIQKEGTGSANSLAESRLLGNSILCYMKEVIHGSPNYTQWKVGSNSIFDNNAETRLGVMPSVIVEVGFHTNLDDAAALQNATFRTAAMKGVEKGYRLYAAGKTACAPLKISSIPNVTAPRPGAVTAKVNYVGYPQFPVTARVELASCSDGGTCTAEDLIYTNNTPSPLTLPFTCSGTSSTTTTSRWRTTLIDADGVKSAPVEHTLTCLATTVALLHGAANGKPSDSVGSQR